MIQQPPEGNNEPRPFRSDDEAMAVTDAPTDDAVGAEESRELAADLEGSGKNGEDLAAALAELQDRHLRLAAELDNFRKRSRRELERVRRSEREAVLVAWLDVVDNMERALAAPAKDETFYQGVKAIHRQMLDVLNGFGVRVMESTGLPFDPNRHEAVAVTPHSDAKDGTIIHTERRGYEFSDGAVLRVARVIVARRS